MTQASPPWQSAVDDTRRWLERAVIGLNLCPFAKAVQVKGLVHFAVSAADEPAQLLREFWRELESLAAADPTQRETTLLVAPLFRANDFLAFNDFLGRCERLIAREGYEGVFQLASFHPLYQFAGSAEDDIANFTNRSPHPTLHLLREASIDQAVQAFPEPEAIYEANIATLNRLGRDGWAALGVGPT